MGLVEGHGGLYARCIRSRAAALAADIALASVALEDSSQADLVVHRLRRRFTPTDAPRDSHAKNPRG